MLYLNKCYHSVNTNTELICMIVLLNLNDDKLNDNDWMYDKLITSLIIFTYFNK